MSNEDARSLGDLSPASSRHNWARSAVALGDETVFAGGDGELTAVSTTTNRELWACELPGYVVSLAASERSLAVGTRGADAVVTGLDPATGERQYSYAVTEDVGTATRDSLLAQPYVVDVVQHGATTIAAVRRYEREGEDRSWESVVLAFDDTGAVQWRHHAPASPIALDVAAAGDLAVASHDDRPGADGRLGDRDGADGRLGDRDGAAGHVAVAYNRRPDPGGHGVVVLDVESGARAWSWDPGTEGDRRVGDVAFVDAAFGDGEPAAEESVDGESAVDEPAGAALAVASHGDHHGWLLDAGGGERWRVDLASARAVDGERVYAYPTHVCAVDDAVVFVTGNTFAESTRDPDARHPREHTAFAVDDAGEVAWTHDVEGFARGVDASAGTVVVPSAQHFRDRSADTHAVHTFDGRDGHRTTRPVAGIAAAVAVDGGTLAVVEEPVAYHDEDETRGAFRLHTWQNEPSTDRLPE